MADVFHIKVLIIDGDMCYISTSAYIGSSSTGLSNYLSGAEDGIEKVIVQDGVCEKLFSLLVGAIPPPLHTITLNYLNLPILRSS